MDNKEIKALNDLKNALLSVNGSLLKLGKNKDDVVILLPDGDFNYFDNILSSGVSSFSNFYVKVDSDKFTLSGIMISKYGKEVQYASIYYSVSVVLSAMFDRYEHERKFQSERYEVYYSSQFVYFDLVCLELLNEQI